MSTPRAHTPARRSRSGVLLGLTVALGATGLLTACSGASGAAPSSSATSAQAAISSSAPASTAAATSPAPEVSKVALGQKVELPSDTMTVSHFLGTSAPKARKPDTAGTHWASFDLKQCAVTDSRMGVWKVALADGSFASQPTSYPDELPNYLQPFDETMPPGFCVGGRVYIAMPDGATATAVVLEPNESNPARAEVQWVIGRVSAAS